MTYYYFRVAGHNLEAVNDEVKLAWTRRLPVFLDRIATKNYVPVMTDDQ